MFSERERKERPKIGKLLKIKEEKFEVEKLNEQFQNAEHCQHTPYSSLEYIKDQYQTSVIFFKFSSMNNIVGNIIGLCWKYCFT